MSRSLTADPSRSLCHLRDCGFWIHRPGPSSPHPARSPQPGPAPAATHSQSGQGWGGSAGTRGAPDHACSKWPRGWQPPAAETSKRKPEGSGRPGFPRASPVEEPGTRLPRRKLPKQTSQKHENERHSGRRGSRSAWVCRASLRAAHMAAACFPHMATQTSRADCSRRHPAHPGPSVWVGATGFHNCGGRGAGDRVPRLKESGRRQHT